MRSASAAQTLKFSIPIALERLRVDMPKWAIDRHFNEITALAARFDVDIDAARVDPMLSPIGRKKRIEQVAVDALKACDQFEADVIEPLSQRIDDLQSDILKVAAAPSKTDGERVIAELRAREIRDSVRGLSREERFALVTAARAAGLGEVVAAIDAAPPQPVRSQKGFVWQSFINQPQEMRSALDLCFEKDPTRGAELRGLAFGRDSLLTNLNIVRKSIREETEFVGLEYGKDA